MIVNVLAEGEVLMISFMLTLGRLLKGLWKSLKMRNFQALLILVLIMLLSGTIFYVTEEGLSIIDALYFCVTTLSTVGHPSFEPRTILGKLFTMVYIIVGTGLFLGLIGFVAYSLIKQPEKPDEPSPS